MRQGIASRSSIARRDTYRPSDDPLDQAHRKTPRGVKPRGGGVPLCSERCRDAEPVALLFRCAHLQNRVANAGGIECYCTRILRSLAADLGV